MCTPTTTLNLPLKKCTYSNYVLYSRLRDFKYFFYLLDCVLLMSTPYPNPKPAPYSNADALNIVVQREKICNIDVRMRSKPR